MRGYLKFTDLKNKKTDCWFTGLPETTTYADLQTFAAALKNYVNPAIVEFGVVRMNQEVITSNAQGIVSAPVDGTSNKDKGFVNFTYVDAIGDTRVVSLWIPNPHKIAHFEHIEGVGYRMVQQSGEDLAAALEDAMGVSGITFIRGRIEYKESMDKGGRNSMRPSLCFKDSTGNLAFMGLPYQFTNIGSVSQFAEVLNGNGVTVPLTFTDSKILYALYPDPSVGYPASGAGMLTANEEWGWDSVDRQAKLRFSYVLLGSKRIFTLSVPGVKASAMEVKTGKRGYSMLKAVGDALATQLTTLYGSSVRNVRFERGRLDALNLQAQ